MIHPDPSQLIPLRNLDHSQHIQEFSSGVGMALDDPAQALGFLRRLHAAEVEISIEGGHRSSPGVVGVGCHLSPLMNDSFGMVRPENETNSCNLRVTVGCWSFRLASQMLGPCGR